MMRRLSLYIAFVVALLLGVQQLRAQSLVLGADYAMLFDNTEYSTMGYASRSETLFSARLTPYLGVEFDDKNRLVLGAELLQDFGYDAKFLSDANVLMYYGFSTPKVKAFAGIFPRDEMYGLRSPLFFDRGYRYYHSRIQGVMARYGADASRYVEFAMDYTGKRSFDTRESFMIMSAGRYTLPCAFGFGYDLLMGHYAKDYNSATDDGVVDNLMLTPYIGYSYDFAVGGGSAPISLGAEARYILSLQRDRRAENVWCAPMGGELLLEVEWYGVSLRNRLYLGDNLLTHYGRYGADVYYGVPFYRTERGVYDAIELSYSQRFFGDRLSIEAGISLDYDGVGWGTRQFILLGVNLNHKVKIKEK